MTISYVSYWTIGPLVNYFVVFFLDHDELVELQKESSGIQEGKWAYSILQHLLIKLAVDNKFVMASYPSLPLPPDMSSGCIGDTSFGMNLYLVTT